MKYIGLSILLLLASIACAEPDLYFSDASGNPVSLLIAQPNRDITVYIFGQTDPGNTYDFFNLGLEYDSSAIAPKNGIATMDLVMSTDSTFGSAFGHGNTTYNGLSLLHASASSFGPAPENFGPILLATAYFEFYGYPTQVKMFDEADD